MRSSILLAAIGVLTFQTPAWAEKPEPVMVTNPVTTVTVGNANSNPVPVVVTGATSPGNQPANGYCSFVQTSLTGLYTCSLYTVPAGKRLVVETVSFNLDVDANANLQRIMVGWCDSIYCDIGNFSPNFYALNLPVPNTYYSNQAGMDMKEYASSQPLRIYLEENQNLVAILKTFALARIGTGFSFSGYLVDK